ncbi:MAG TPA: hypothetical protein VD962_01745, partial [Rubricoccaceae bacterium]|nr:hypothetical protein [Rubricoccaceae bacterium]
MRWLLPLALGAALLAGSPVPSAQSVLRQTLQATQPEFFDLLGVTVTLGEGSDGVLRALVGAIGDGPGSPSSGAVHVFRLDPDSVWRHEAELAPSDPDLQMDFGRSVAYLADPIRGDLALVGAPLWHTNDLGKAYFFRRHPATGAWAEEFSFREFPVNSSQQLGSAAALCALPGGAPGEALAAIGARGDDDAGGFEGAVYVFRYDADSTAWVREAKLLPPGPPEGGAQGDDLGRSAALLPLPGGAPGEVLLLGGAPNFRSGPQTEHNREGAAYVWRRDGATGAWAYETRLTATPLQRSADFGWSAGLLALPGGAPGEALAVVGAFGTSDPLPPDPTGNRRGALFAFRRVPGPGGSATWVQEARLMGEPRTPEE